MWLSERGSHMGGQAKGEVEREMTKDSSSREEGSLREQLKQGTANCPRCGATLEITPVQPRPDVAYVRNRALLSCLRCDFKAVVDR
jgi:transcription elongation factor Elf1